VLLDGSHDWLTVPAEPVGLFELDLPGRRPAPPVAVSVEPVVTTMVKADLRCAAVAAASVLAKVERDAIMTGRAADFPLFGWPENKGYSAPEHVAALRRYGPCVQHRRTWSLPVAQVLAAEGLQVEALDDGAGDREAHGGGVLGEVLLDEGALEQVAVRGACGEREDPGLHADGVVPLRHDGAVVR
jgi:Ribonuclease HII